MGYFAWLFFMMLTFLVYLWPLSLGLVALTVAGIVLWRRKKSRPPLPAVALFSCFTFPVAILIYGTVWSAGPSFEPNPHADMAPYVVFPIIIAQLVASIALVFFAKSGLRLLVLAAVSWEIVLSLCAGFVAFMSVSGQWL
jgi:hypothetical protein